MTLVVGALCMFSLSCGTSFATGIEVVKHLGGADTGQHPFGGLLRAEDGLFYGTTREGGRYGYGTIYRMAADGMIEVLVDLDDTMGRYPEAALTEHSGGSFYGTTAYGGAGGYGTIFRVTSSGTMTMLASFSGQNGANPRGRLLRASDGQFYGVTQLGGPSNYGTVFRVTSTGAFSTLATFDYSNGAYPDGPLVEVSPGEFLGVFQSGTPSPFGGGVFKVTSAGIISTFKAFDNGSLAKPEAGLLKADDGNFYGTTAMGGTNNVGAIYRLSPDAEIALLASFTGTNGIAPSSELIAGPDGDFYGTTTGKSSSNIMATVFRVSREGVLQTLATLPPLSASFSDNYHLPSLCLDADGSLLGVTPAAGRDGKGTVFRVAATGGLATLASFMANSPTNPEGSLTAGSDGILYGAAPMGGASGVGGYFSITPTGRFTTILHGNTEFRNPQSCPFFASDGHLYATTERGGTYSFGNVLRLPLTGSPVTLFSFNSFDPGSTWGAVPKGGLIESADGSLIGTTTDGGNAANQGGTIFKLSKSGTISLIKSFSGPDGSHAGPGLLTAADGSLYGVTRFGGPQGGGTVFRISPEGTHSILADFSNSGTGGKYPQGELVWGPSGEIWGTTSNGGLHGQGTVFSVDLAGRVRVLHSFRGTDGSYPYAGLLLAGDGNYYGTTYSGGAGGWGTVFRLTPGGEISTFASFYGPEGKYLYGALVENSDGDLYGTTRSGGALNRGTIFRLTIRPPMVTPMAFPGGTVGQVVTIHGRHFGSANSVAIGGAAVPFTVVSPTEIDLALPATGRAGSLRISTPAGEVELPGLFSVISSQEGDDDNDGLPNSWEVGHGLNPHDDGSINPDFGPSGDGDGDGVPLLIEWALSGSGMRPDVADSRLLGEPEVNQGELVWEYVRDLSKAVDVRIEASADLEHWFSAGEPGAPAGFSDQAIPGEIPMIEKRRATLPLEGWGRGFFRLAAMRTQPGPANPAR